MGYNVVLGAGLAGLNAALKLSEISDKPTVVIEKLPYIGGLSATMDWSGARIDFGPHRIYTEMPEVREQIEGLVGNELISVPRTSHMYLKNRFLAYPPQMMQMGLKLGPFTALKWGTSYLASKVFSSSPGDEEESYESFLCRHFGRSLYKDFFHPYALKVWQKEPAELSADIVKTRVASRSLLSSVFGKTEKEDRPASVREFPYPSGGIGRIPEVLAERLKQKGIRIYTNTEPVKISLHGQRISSLVYSDVTTNRQDAFQVERIVSTIPLIDLLRLFPVTEKATALESAARLQHVRIRIVYLMLSREKVRDDTWLYFPESECPFSRIYEVRNFSPDAVPPGKTVLCVEVPVPQDDRYPNVEMMEEVVDGLSKIGLATMKDVEDVFYADLPHAYPLYDLGYRERVENVLVFLSAYENLISTGRQGLFAYNNLDHSMRIGTMAAEAVNKGAWSVRAFYAERDELCNYQIVD